MEATPGGRRHAPSYRLANRTAVRRTAAGRGARDEVVRRRHRPDRAGEPLLLARSLVRARDRPELDRLSRRPGPPLDRAAGPCHLARVERMGDQERAVRGAADPPSHFHGSSSSAPPPCRKPSRPPSTRPTNPANSARPRPATASITSVWPCFLAL